MQKLDLEIAADQIIEHSMNQFVTEEKDKRDFLD